MSSFSQIVFWTCIGYGIYHFAWAVWFRIALPRSRSPINPGDRFQPFVSIILSLRGKDPFVATTVDSLLNQDYGDYELQVIVDSPGDPVWECIGPYKNHPRIKISLLKDRLKTCSLKCSAIVQAISDVAPQTEVIALADADIAPSDQWLNRLVSPLADPKIGVVTGNQWFSPKQNRVGSVVRSLWNAGAIIVTFLAKHTWAGSCAMRLDEVRASGLIDKWSKTIVDDGPIDGAMRKLKVKTVFMADLISVNREECDFAFSIRYNSRMLTWSRIYEWGFLATFAHMAFTVSLVLAAFFSAVYLLINGNLLPGLKVLGGLLFIQVVLLFAYFLVENAIRSINGELNEQLTPFSFSKAAKFGALIPVALFVYCVSALRATFAKKIKWRNATYEIRNCFDIRLLDDQPFSPTSLPADQSSSI